eukprot:TRINITY_DN36174_c0_g1_i1.p1 TRINITY_DN36174_c0_g1~~TRINITY_DN36174_c0_g1_i1.p1  ORF type:complete len:187 (+),score=37.51 TRINITY_DN36174_c0_g1_i1:86-646(+)
MKILVRWMDGSELALLEAEPQTTMRELKQAAELTAPGKLFTLKHGGSTAADGFTVGDLELEDGDELVAEEDIVLHMRGHITERDPVPWDMHPNPSPHQDGIWLAYATFRGPLAFDIVMPKKDMEFATVAYLKKANKSFQGREVEDVQFRFNNTILADGLLSEAGIQNDVHVDFFVQTCMEEIINEH